MSQRLLVTGSQACFQRSEMKCDLVSYDVITPMAARAIFEAVHWTPSIRWRVDRIEVLQPIRMQQQNVRSGGSAEEREGQGVTGGVSLLDVAYLLEARFDLTDAAGPADSAAQHANMFRRRAKQRRFFRSPYLGRRQFVADVRSPNGDEALRSHYAGKGAVDLGWMIFDRDPLDGNRLRYYRPMMVDGIIDLTGVDAASLPC